MVLVNEGSASASEILAELSQMRIRTLNRNKTFGKALVQQIKPWKMDWI